MTAGSGFLDLDSVVVYSTTGGEHNSSTSTGVPSELGPASDDQSGGMNLPNNGTAQVDASPAMPDSANACVAIISLRLTVPDHPPLTVRMALQLRG